MMKIRDELYSYDIYPKVLAAGKKTSVTISPRGVRPFADTEFTLKILPLISASPSTYPTRPGRGEMKVRPDGNGEIKFDFDFPIESEYFIRIFDGDRRILQMSVYAVEGNLIGRYPLIGDQHMHTIRSDGQQSPAMVCANYRSYGYDYMAVTDHGRYYPSLEVMEDYKDVDHALALLPGEEVHLPGNDIHIVNFGGKYSVNGIWKDSAQIKEAGEDVSKRTYEGFEAPKLLTTEEMHAEAEALLPSLNLPDDIEPLPYAMCVWEFNHIKKAGGVGIFAHPYWISDMFQVPESFNKYMLEHHPFGAFELLGGEIYYEHNGFQFAMYNDIRAEGIDFPVVGSTDSHNSYPNNSGSRVDYTVTFAPENTRESLVSSILDGCSAAVDSTMPEDRVYGKLRLVKYTWFLIRNYFTLPCRAGIAAEDGRLMAEYALSRDPDRKAELARRISDLKKDYLAAQKKYIGF